MEASLNLFSGGHLGVNSVVLKLEPLDTIKEGFGIPALVSQLLLGPNRPYPLLLETFEGALEALTPETVTDTPCMPYIYMLTLIPQTTPTDRQIRQSHGVPGIMCNSTATQNRSLDICEALTVNKEPPNGPSRQFPGQSGAVVY